MFLRIITRVVSRSFKKIWERLKNIMIKTQDFRWVLINFQIWVRKNSFRNLKTNDTINLKVHTIISSPQIPKVGLLTKRDDSLGTEKVKWWRALTLMTMSGSTNKEAVGEKTGSKMEKLGLFETSKSAGRVTPRLQLQHLKQDRRLMKRKWRWVAFQCNN